MRFRTESHHQTLLTNTQAMSSKNNKNSSFEDSSSNRQVTSAISSILTYTSEPAPPIVTMPQLNLADPSLSTNVRSIIIIRNESGYGFTLSRYAVGQSDGPSLISQESDPTQHSDSEKVCKNSFILKSAVYI